MQQPDFTRFRAVMAGMAEMYQRELSGTLLDAYWLALRDWSLPDFEAAAGHLMAVNTFMPRPSDFNALRKAGRPTSAEAWQLAWQGNPTGDYAIAQALAAAAGPERLGMINIDRLPWVEKRFREAYDELVDVVEHREAVPQITQHTAPRLDGPTQAADGLRQLTARAGR